MATLQDRRNPSRKARVTADGEQVIIGSGAGGAVPVITGGGEEAMIIDDTTTTDITYFCFADIGSLTSDAAWKIYVFDETSGVLVKKYADGDSSYDNIADNRASLSYS